MSATLGIEVVTRPTARARAGIPVTDRIVKQPYGLVHGGALLTLAETLTSYGTWVGVRTTGCSRWARRSTPACCARSAEGHVNGTARARRKGRTAWVWEVEITDDDGRLCALVRRGRSVFGRESCAVSRGER